MKFKYRGYWSWKYSEYSIVFYTNELFTKFCKYCDKYSIEIDKVEVRFKSFKINVYFKYYNNLELNKIKRYYQVFKKKYM